MNNSYRQSSVLSLFLGFLLFFLISSFLPGCSSNLVKPVQAADPFGLFTDAIMKGFVNADKNFHLAVTNGDLDATDPIIPCFDAIVGTQNPNAQPYDTSGPIELASVAYIKFNSIQAKAPQVSKTCDALVGKFVRDAIRNAPVNPIRPVIP